MVSSPSTHTPAWLLTEASDYWGSGLGGTGSFCARAARFNQWQAAKASVLLPHSTREDSGKSGSIVPYEMKGLLPIFALKLAKIINMYIYVCRVVGSHPRVEALISTLISQQGD